MKLVIHELRTYVEQEYTIAADEHIDAVSMRPHLIRFDFPVGTARLQVRDSNKKLIAQSNAVAISDMDLDEPLGENYFHGYIRFDINAPLKAGETYWIRLVATGYTFSESAYLGWCNDFDLRKVPALYTPNDGWSAALDLEIWGRKRSVRGSQA